jgi:hypothetical protein
VSKFQSSGYAKNGKVLKMAVFWDDAQCNLVDTDRLRSISIRLHGVASQKTAIIISVAVKT